MKSVKWKKMVFEDGRYFWFKDVMDLTSYVTQQLVGGKVALTHEVVLAIHGNEIGPTFKNIIGLKEAQKIGDGLIRDYLNKCIKMLG